MAEQSCNIKFVEEVEKHPCLYNYKLPEYCRKDLTEKAWIEVGKKVNLTRPQAKEKWKNLRAVFVRNMKTAPSGSSAKKKPYYLINAMMFTLPFVKVLNSSTSGNLPPIDQDENFQDEIEDQTSLPSPLSDSLTESHSMPPQTPMPLSSPSIPHSSPSSLPSSRKSRKPKDLAEVDENFNEYLKNKISKTNVTDNISVNSSNKMFLLSLLSDLNTMSSSQIRCFKRRVLDLVEDILQENSTASSSRLLADTSSGVNYVLDQQIQQPLLDYVPLQQYQNTENTSQATLTFVQAVQQALGNENTTVPKENNCNKLT